MVKRTVALAVVGMALLLSPASAATLDRNMTVQGMVSTSGGLPANGTYDIEFRLYTAATGGTALWSQLKADVVVTQGMFDVSIGPVTSGPMEQNAMLWLETVVDGTALPRQPLRPVGYALVAQQANNLQCSGCVDPSELASGTYGINISGNAASAATATTALSAGSFTGQLAGDVTGAQGSTSVGRIRGVAVSATTPSAGQVLKYTGGQWVPSGDANSGGTVTSVGAGSGLTGGPITGAGTLSIAPGGVTPSMVASGSYGISITGNAATATSAASLSGVLSGDVQGPQSGTAVTKIRGVTVATTTPANGQVLKYNSGTTQWEPGTDSAGTGTVTQVATGKGLQGGPITGSGSVSVRVNTAGGLSDSLGGGSNELGIKPSGVTPGMVAGGTYGISISGTAAAANTATSATSFTGALGGDVTGTQGATTVGKLRGVPLATTAPANGQVLKFESSSGTWKPAADASGSGVSNVTASSPLTSSGGLTPNISIGTVPVAKGGTGITSGPTGVGQFLRSTGSGQWGVAGLQAGDIPGGSGNYIMNGTGQQSANFNVSGAGTVGGTMTATGDMRSKIFYDLDNTGYYLNPASSSQMSAVYANDWFRPQGQTGLYFQDYGGGFHMTDTTWVRVYNGKALLADGEIRSSSNVRAPIFYDLNNASYQVDPNGNTRLANVHTDAVLLNWPGYNGIAMANGHYLWPGRVDGGGSWQQSWYLASHGSYGLYTNTGIYAAGSMWSPRYYDANDTNYYVDAASVSYFNDIRPNILYDRQNTGYYLDPNSTSQLHYVLANNWFRAQGDTGFYFETHGGGIYMVDSSWVRVYNNKHFLNTGGIIRSDVDMRAPIFYDQNNTGYYVDPNGTSHLNATQFDGRVFYGGGCPAPFTSYGATHSYGGYSNKVCMWRYGNNIFSEMQNVCFALGGHICSYSEVYAIARAYGTSPAGIGIGNGWWLGNYVSDDVAFCVNNQNDRSNFEGHCHKHNNRYAACCYASTYAE